MTAIIAGSLIAIGLAVFLVVLWKMRSDPRRQIEKAEKAAREGNDAAAEAGFRRTLMLLANTTADSPELQEIVARAHLALAEIELARGERQKTAEHYVEALAAGAALATEQTLLLAEWYAESKQQSEEAISAYLTYLTSGPKTGPAAIQVYAVMHGICEVSEEMKPAQRRHLAGLNRKVIDANPRLEWAHYFLALATLLDGRATEAIPTFIQAQTLNPDRMLTYYWLAVCQLQLAAPQLEAAMQFIDQFLARAQKDGKNRKREARVCAEISRRLIERADGVGTSSQAISESQSTDLDKAIHYLRIAAERQPLDASTQHNLGKACQRRGTTAEALAALRRAAELDPAEKFYAFDLGMQCLQLGQASDAMEALERAVQISPGFEEAHGELARIYFEQHKLDKACTHFQAAFASGKRNPVLLGLWMRALCEQEQYARVTDEMDRRSADPTLFRDDLDAACAAGRSYSAQGRFKDAIGWLSKVQGKPAATYYMGCAHANLKEFAEARACLDILAGAEDHWSSKALLQRGHILALQGDHSGAQEDYRKVLAADPANCQSLQALGSIALDQGDFAEAVSMFSAAVAAQPENMEATLLLGIALERKGSLAEALQSYAIASRSATPELALLREGVVRCRLGEFAEALKVLGSCVENSANSDTLLFYRGLAFALLSRGQDAIRDWSKLQQRHPENDRLRLNLARARYLLGSQLLARGERDAALAQWEQYMTLYPLDESVARDAAELTFQQALDLLAGRSSADLKTVRGHLHKALQRDPGNPLFRFYAALCDVSSGTGTVNPMKDLRALAAEEWSTPRVLYHLGWCELQHGQTEAAVATFRQVQAIPDADAYGRYASWALANAMIAKGDFHEASQILMSVAAPINRAGMEVSQ